MTKGVLNPLPRPDGSKAIRLIPDTPITSQKTRPKHPQPHNYSLSP
jgi:hypothetical protein